MLLLWKRIEPAMKFPRLAFAAFTAVALLITNSSNADIFALYNFDDQGVDKDGLTESVFPDPPTDVIPGLYNTRIDVKQTASSTKTFGDIAVPPEAADIHAYVRTSETLAINTFDTGGTNNQAYHEFTITTPSDTNTYALDSIQFEYWVSNAVDGATYEASVYSNLAGYQAGDRLQTVNAETDPSGVRTRTINLQGIDRGLFSNIAGGTNVEFRILFSDNSTNSVVDHHRVDDVTVRGRVVVTAVPEPSTASVLMLIGATAFLRRRRSHI
jgi:hypothetical protein